MKNHDSFLLDDFQVSYDAAISAIQQIFNDEIKHCQENIDNKLAEYLKGFKDEFLGIFKHCLEHEMNKKISEKIS